MNGVPLVSVVIIFLDAGRYLDEAIASILAQTYPAWELLLVNDGSSDGSGTIARRYAVEYPDRARYLAHDGHRNRGMSASRNLGAAHARGEYITFLDADDVLLPHALDLFVTLATAEPRAAMVYGPVEYWYDWPGSPHRDRRNFVQRLGVPTNVVLKPPELLLRFLRRRAAAPSGVLVRSEVFREVGGFEESFRGMYEDQAFCAKICLRWPVLATDACVYRYRQHPASSSAAADRSGEPDFGRTPFLEWLENYLRAHAIADEEIWRALRTEVWWSRHPGLHRAVRRIRRIARRLLPR